MKTVHVQALDARRELTKHGFTTLHSNDGINRWVRPKALADVRVIRREVRDETWIIEKEKARA